MNSLVGGGPPVGQLRVRRVREVVEHSCQGSLDESLRHVQTSRHHHITVSAGGTLQRQIPRDQERSVGISHGYDALALGLEVIDHAAQDFHAHVDLGLQVREGQLCMPRGQPVIEGERLVYLHEMDVLVAAIAQEGYEHLVGDLVRRAALLEDPHRIGVRIRRDGWDLEQLGDVVRQPRRPVLRIGNEASATGCEDRDCTYRDQAQPQNHPQNRKERVGQPWQPSGVDHVTGQYAIIGGGASARREDLADPLAILNHGNHLATSMPRHSTESTPGATAARLAQIAMMAVFREAREGLLDAATRLMGELYRAVGFEEVAEHVEYVQATQPDEHPAAFVAALRRHVPGPVSRYLEPSATRDAPACASRIESLSSTVLRRRSCRIRSAVRDRNATRPCGNGMSGEK